MVALIDHWPLIIPHWWIEHWLSWKSKVIVKTLSTRKYSSRMHTTCLSNVMLWWPPDVSISGGEGDGSLSEQVWTAGDPMSDIQGGTVMGVRFRTLCPGVLGLGDLYIDVCSLWVMFTPPWTEWLMERHVWKHYLPETFWWKLFCLNFKKLKVIAHQKCDFHLRVVVFTVKITYFGFIFIFFYFPSSTTAQRANSWKICIFHRC